MSVSTGLSPLEELKDHDPTAYQYFLGEFDRLQKHMYKELREFCDDLDENGKLLFVKVFDPYNVLPALSVCDASNGAADAQVDEDEGVEDDAIRGYPFGLDDPSKRNNASNGASDRAATAVTTAATGTLAGAGTIESKEEGDAPLCEEKMEICGVEGQHHDAAAAAARASGGAAKKKSNYMPTKYLGNIVLSTKVNLSELSTRIKQLIDRCAKRTAALEGHGDKYVADYDPVEALQ